ncbi:bifunctional isocitrate dehydrogenase kinase/phosphatase [Echinicola marina]|uniref:bifunctional isocitrate dehydrogenase kinase/phosphatase n=1 Tax=Echinicola marina TaxID=2859768 RepID=UPI001CF68DBF|nr:bifunctional isocitrate dehydrogenase kinase/phosphatase [Echinicola marina]UCS92451.1 bifunctional isocitrate dehydrogenase kinase/phosphatase [Echinicola marina]
MFRASTKKPLVVDEIINGYIKYINSFNEYTKRAPIYFRERDWDGVQLNQRQRLRLYKDCVNEVVKICKVNYGEYLNDRHYWLAVKHSFSETINERNDKELAESFYNSVIRKSVAKLSIDEELMFVLEGYDSCEIHPQENLFHNYPSTWGVQKIIRKILEDFDFKAPYFQKEKDVQFLVRSIREVILTRYEVDKSTTTQVLKQVFYRNKAAYLIGRTFLGGKWMPFIIPFMHGPNGVFVDTLIFDPNLMSAAFSYTRSYFMVETEIPSQIVAFLNSVITHKKVYELYNAIGFNKHGKTEFYRDFLNHQNTSDDQYTLAPGIKGMVMTVFTLPSYNIVFKMIKDSFDPPKNMTRQEVKDKYRLVSLHDRVGRMADTHEFEYFKLPLDRVHPDLLRELRNTVNSLIEIKDDTLILKHLYTERRLTPLNMYLEDCSLEDAKIVVEEYGNAILQLAKANIFPGDMMTKNFGVTRQKRVIFYDYDEIEFLTQMNFREKPKPRTFEEIYAASPWYEIAKNDVFPEDFRRFMIGRADVKPYFLDFHKDLFDPAHWRNIQKRIENGEFIHAFPYPDYMRFRPHEPV